MLKAAREVTKGKVVAVMQPHRYTRLSSLFNEFCTCFNDADTVIVAPVYAAGEAPIEGATHDALAEGLHGARPPSVSTHRQAGATGAAGAQTWRSRATS